ncbi:MAG: hypothetical protein ACLP8X_41215 [Streptosporangiaceae bacterium]
MKAMMTWRATGPARLSFGLARIARRVAHRIAKVVAECNYAQRRSFAIMTNPDSYLTDRDQAPDTYAEFLFRTSGGLLHEPASAQRAHGRLPA